MFAYDHCLLERIGTRSPSPAHRWHWAIAGITLESEGLMSAREQGLAGPDQILPRRCHSPPTTPLHWHRCSANDGRYAVLLKTSEVTGRLRSEKCLRVTVEELGGQGGQGLGSLYFLLCTVLNDSQMRLQSAMHHHIASIRRQLASCVHVQNTGTVQLYQCALETSLYCTAVVQEHCTSVACCSGASSTLLGKPQVVPSVTVDSMATSAAPCRSCQLRPQEFNSIPIELIQRSSSLVLQYTAVYAVMTIEVETTHSCTSKY